MTFLDVLKDKYISDTKILSKKEFCSIYKYPFLLSFENGKSNFVNSKAPTLINKTIEEIMDRIINPKVVSILPIAKTTRNPFLKKITIGRTNLQDIVIKDMSISKFHAYFYIDEDNNYFLVDNNSTNGTFINRNSLEADKAILLNDNDIISLSDLDFTFCLPETVYSIISNN